MTIAEELAVALKSFTDPADEPIPCEECGEDSAVKITYLLEGYRNNPGSRAYGKDDCSWCADESAHACHAHRQKMEWNPPHGYVHCSTFFGEKFPHMIHQKAKPDADKARDIIARFEAK